MVWALESIPCLQQYGNNVDRKALPRMLKWEVKTRVSSAKVEALLQSEEVEIISKMRPSKLEKQKPYYLALMKGGESDDTTEDDMEPSCPMQECPEVEPKVEIEVEPKVDYGKVKEMVVGVVREENKVIYYLLDAMQQKIDLLMAKSSQSFYCEKCGDDIRHVNDMDGGDEEECEAKETNMATDDIINPASEEKESYIMADKEKSAMQVDPTNEDKVVNLVKVRDEEYEEEPIDHGLPLMVKLGLRWVTKKENCENKPPIRPVKRRKLNFDAYDPYQEADHVLMELCEKWLVTNEDSALVRLVDYEVQARTLKYVAKEGLMPNFIFDTSLCEIRRRSTAYPELFEQDACVVDSIFSYYMKTAFEIVVKTNKGGKILRVSQRELSIYDKYSRILLNYVDGKVPHLSKSWAVCRYLYVSIVDVNHWFVVRVDFNDRKLYVYDSFPGHVRKTTLDAWLVPLQVGISWLLKTHVDGYEDYSLAEFAVEKVKGLPIQRNGVDCGIISLRAIEFLTGRWDVLSIQLDYIPFWRKKLVVELLAWRFEP